MQQVFIPFSVPVSVPVSVPLFIFRNGDSVKEKQGGPTDLFDEPMMQWMEDQEKQKLTPYKDKILQEYGRMRASLDAAVSVPVAKPSGEGWWRGFKKKMDLAPRQPQLVET